MHRVGEGWQHNHIIGTVAFEASFGGMDSLGGHNRFSPQFIGTRQAHSYSHPLPGRLPRRWEVKKYIQNIGKAGSRR
jgi:hypothetical protein